MIRTISALLAASGLSLASTQAGAEERPWALVLHGGAGVIERADMDADTEAAYRAALSDALALGAAMLESGAPAIDAVEAVIRIMEDEALFNAGRGAVFTSDGRIEHDASIMRASDRQAGAAAGVRGVRHLISLARAVMDESPHVMLQGAGAESFADEQGLERVEESYFFTERRWAAMERQVQSLGLPVPPRPEGAPEPEPVREGSLLEDARSHRFGTVGVVALDRTGELVAGTSTGGTTAKRWGRVGDSPVIGAGTYAGGACGVSATGTGEYFIRLSVAARICARIDLAGEDGQTAADAVIQDELTAMGGDGGVVMIHDGTPLWSFNTSGMYRASQIAGGEPVVAIFDDEG
ncbi:isoaspartyl peptidase/L-asparaginase [Alkalicaulis satelles]|uniref:Isoaspartyl peptidase n=1 Tax=Alkalicaulis satelles TaxID=2609175 RepID=A0A5M6Z8S6_9PROT|nr:isoaspartyl peptidase/L-asparaginase [Alkalicaulis satelles]KAA5801043.1 isoaspartyl peptidase/L-asparaginase [Alkalicaulis satelles]